MPGAGTQPVTDRFTFEMPTPTYPAPGRPLPGAETQPVTNQFAYELPTVPTSGQGRLPPRIRTQPVPDRFMDDMQDMPNPVIDIDRLSPRAELYDLLRPLGNAGSGSAVAGPARRDLTTIVCFSCSKPGHGVGRCPELDEPFPYMLPG